MLKGKNGLPAKEKDLEYFDMGEQFPVVALCDDCKEQAEFNGHTLKPLGRADTGEVCDHCGTVNN